MLHHILINLLFSLKRLAHSGLWWRITTIGLVLCGTAPDTLGKLIWDEYPTIRALMKMTIAGKYRFPTTDCNEEEREMMKANDYALRNQVSLLMLNYI